MNFEQLRSEQSDTSTLSFDVRNFIYLLFSVEVVLHEALH